VVTEATHLVHFALSIDLGIGYLKTAPHPKKTGQEFHHVVPTLSATLPMAHLSVVAVIIQIM
jgi:hypothetical protein